MDLQYEYSNSKDIPVQNIQSVWILQYKIFSQYGSPVQNIQPAGVFKYKIFSQYGYSGIKYSVSMDMQVQNIRSVWILQYISIDIPVTNIQSVWIF
jgi:hypothetical protein